MHSCARVGGCTWTALWACSPACACGPCIWQLEQVTQLEQEEEVLLQGLRVMTRGRDWCLQQLQHVQERQRLGQSKTSADFGAEGSPPALGRLLPKVQEVARCLGELLAAACAGRVSAPGHLTPMLGSRPSSVPPFTLVLEAQPETSRPA